MQFPPNQFSSEHQNRDKPIELGAAKFLISNQVGPRSGAFVVWNWRLFKIQIALGKFPLVLEVMLENCTFWECGRYLMCTELGGDKVWPRREKNCAHMRIQRRAHSILTMSPGRMINFRNPENGAVYHPFVVCINIYISAVRLVLLATF